MGNKDIEYLMPGCLKNINPHDWAYWNKAKFDVIDKRRFAELHNRWNSGLGNARFKDKNAKLGSMDLRRWLPLWEEKKK